MGLKLQVTGSCTCKQVRYRLTEKPLFTHCCHCRWCQRETGSAFVINAMIESVFIDIIGTQPVTETIPSESGRGQLVARCPNCKIAVWSHYSLGEVMSFVRVGTLDDPDTCPPDVHIFTQSKQPWVTLNDGKPICETFYNRNELWPEDSLIRFSALLDAR